MLGDSLDFGDPPTEIIDFLGRRSACAQSGVPAEEQARLACSAIDGEEQGWRSRFDGDVRAMRWLDQAPLAFRMSPRFVSTFDGPSPTDARRIEQSGVDEEGRPYWLVVDTGVDGGSATRITARYADWPERSFTLDNRAYPLIDLHSLAVGSSPFPEFPGMTVQFHYGHPRGYCGEIATDDRPRISVGFEPGRVRGTDMRRTNCQRGYVEIEDVAAR